MELMTITEDNLDAEHLCCAIADKKCAAGVAAKKELIRSQIPLGYRFDKLNVRGKVFIESVPGVHSWLPAEAPGYRVINCFWVAGQYKGQGWAKALLNRIASLDESSSGLVAVTAEKKRPFLSDPGFLNRQGFEVVDRAAPDFLLWARKTEASAPDPRFLDSARSGRCEDNGGLTVFYSDFCPFPHYWNTRVLAPWAAERNIPLTLHHIRSRDEARAVPVPHINNAVFYKGEYITSEIKIDKLLAKRFGVT